MNDINRQIRGNALAQNLLPCRFWISSKGREDTELVNCWVLLYLIHRVFLGSPQLSLVVGPDVKVSWTEASKWKYIKNFGTYYTHKLLRLYLSSPLNMLEIFNLFLPRVLFLNNYF